MARAAQQQRRVHALQLLGAAALPLLLYPLIAASIALAALKRAFGIFARRPTSVSTSIAPQQPPKLSLEAATANSSKDDDYDLTIRVVGGGGVESGKGGGDDAGAVEMRAAAVSCGEAVMLRNDVLGDDIWALLGPLLRAHGDGAVAYSTLANPEFCHLLLPGVGSLAFVEHARYGRRLVMAVGDPLAPRGGGAWRALAAELLRREPGAYFGHASEEFAGVLHGLGLHCDELGVETRLDARRFAYCARTRTVRNDARNARASGLAPRELGDAELTPGVRAQLAAVTGEWLATKACSERVMRVLVRHLDTGALHLKRAGEARLFVAESVVGGDGEGGGDDEGDDSVTTTTTIEAFMLLDPMLRAGAVVGFVPSIARAAAGAHPGALKLLHEHVLGVLRAEGVRELNLGFAPFASPATGAAARRFRSAWWLRLAGRFLFAAGGPLYAFQPLAFAKAKWAGGVRADADGGASFRAAGTALTRVYIGHQRAQPFGFAPLDAFLAFQVVGFVGGVAETAAKLARGGGC